MRDILKKNFRRTTTVLPHGDNYNAVHKGCLDQDVCDDHDDVQANNNRLANYIDKVRQLQTENRRMTKQIQVKTIINRSSESSLNNLLEQAGENWETVEAYDSKYV